MEKGNGVRVACGWSRCGGLGFVPASDLVSTPLPVHAAVLAINEAVERGVVEDTLAALRNPSALLENLREPLAAIYQELLAQAKAEKTASAQTRVRRSLCCAGVESGVAQKASGGQDSGTSCLHGPELPRETLVGCCREAEEAPRDEDSGEKAGDGFWGLDLLAGLRWGRRTGRDWTGDLT